MHSGGSVMLSTIFPGLWISLYQFIPAVCCCVLPWRSHWLSSRRGDRLEQQRGSKGEMTSSMDASFSFSYSLLSVKEKWKTRVRYLNKQKTKH